ncbi:MFS transporter [Enterococcus dongliensis]|uniref:MFS transporter n=1 Tax=Enterococcus dongliensis TaxID=2559925 RepID=A0AAP5KQN3_9ENTE|nr:MFS transporter [Enterococcus dongliensis]MDT2596745.1 MFS transporter [Enterococcus dongliensis]MDT2604586.1 MFS transporter [Enterococcus dongliensis]MDT2635126.1 MFS transporter [Enterococcus dongliensis]MDT2636565.1 MFS transporter [Enterococcus dongliensis]MDT2640743.1 MFS transporter [Enterococcus dongliensis]
MEKKLSPNFTLLALAINAFAIGSTEFISVGLLPMIVKSFNVTLAQAGLTVSLYALGVTIGAPLLTILTGKWNRRNLMIGIMLLFISGNLLAAFAPTFPILLLGRVLAALAHGIFMSVSTVIAADVVAPSRRASAIAIMFTGLTVATVTGVPLGTFIGQQTTWNMSFIFIAVVGLLGLIASSFLVPHQLPIPGKVDLKGFVRIFTNKPLVLSFLITAFGYGGTFSAYTYLSPILENFGFSANAVVIILIVYGVMVAIGNTIGGRLANEKPLASLLNMFGLLLAALLFLFITILIGTTFLGLLAAIILGLFAFMNVPGLQLYVVQLAEKYVPQDITLASAFNIAAFNVGITLGSTVGAQVTDKIGIAYTPLFGAVIVLFAILFVLQIKRSEAINTLTEIAKCEE